MNSPRQNRPASPVQPGDERPVADAVQTAVNALTALMKAADELDKAMGKLAKPNRTTSLPGGERFSRLELLSVAEANPQVANLVAAIQTSLDALDAAASDIVAEAMDGKLGEARRSVLLRHRNAALSAVSWLPVLKDHRTGKADSMAPAHRVWHALCWGMTSGEARRWNMRRQAAEAGRAAPGPMGAAQQSSTGSGRPANSSGFQPK